MKNEKFSFTYKGYDNFICDEAEYVVKVWVSFENKSNKSDEAILKDIKNKAIKEFLNYHNSLQESADGSRYTLEALQLDCIEVASGIQYNYNYDNYGDVEISRFDIGSIDYSEESMVKFNEARKLEIEAAKNHTPRECKAPTKTVATSDELTLATKNSTGGGINVVPYIVSGIFIVLFVAVVILIIKRKKNSTSF